MVVLHFCFHQWDNIPEMHLLLSANISMLALVNPFVNAAHILCGELISAWKVLL